MAFAGHLSSTPSTAQTGDFADCKTDILFASNNVALAVDVTIGASGLSGSLAPGSVMLSMEPEDTISLAVGIKDALYMSTISVFSMNKGLEVKLYPEQCMIIAPTVLPSVPPFDVAQTLRIRFRSPASFWAFAFYTSGTGYNFGFNFPKDSHHAPLTMSMPDCEDFLQRRGVVEFPGDRAASWDL